MTHSAVRSHRRKAVALGVAAALITTLTIPLGASVATAAEPDGLAGSDLYVNPWSTTLEAAQSLKGQARDDAQLLGSIPSGEWITKGTPDEARDAVDEVVTAAAARGEMPVIVAYNLPFRDCAQYSSGGALDTAAYQAWIDGVVEGIGDRDATVILEPDGLGIIPHYTTLDGNAEWCQPAELDAATAASDRYIQLNYAVDALAALDSAAVYLDGTGASWLNVAEITDRLLKGGVERADGFFLNASNYQFTANSTYFGEWVSSCITVVTEVPGGSYGDCGNQYWAGGPANNWGGDWTGGFGGALSQYGEWSDDAADQALNTAGVESRYASALQGYEPTTGFVIDTSRNGLGPWQYPAGVYSAHEDWCNPPDRGAGALPDTDTGNPLVDAYLWIKVPGESDGKCFRGTEGPLDPERGIEDPAAGQWFVEQARELVALSNPELEKLTCDVKVRGTKVGKGFLAAVTVRNTGDTKVADWELSWTFDAGQKVLKVIGGSFDQEGAEVAVSGPSKRSSLSAGKQASFVVTGKGAATEPWLFHLNGAACTS